jgi:hypothetical protein
LEGGSKKNKKKIINEAQIYPRRRNERENNEGRNTSSPKRILKTTTTVEILEMERDETITKRAPSLFGFSWWPNAEFLHASSSQLLLK